MAHTCQALRQNSTNARAPLVKEFCANMKGMKQGQIFVCRKWIAFNEKIRKAIGCPEPKDELFKSQTDEPNTEESEATLWKKD